MTLPKREHYFGQYAGFTSRLLAYTIDLIVVFVSITVLGWLLRITVDLLQVQRVAAMLGLSWGVANLSPTSGLVLRGLAFIVGAWLYQVFFLSLANQTLGKAILGLQVIPLKGGRVGPIRATVRYLGYIVAILPFFLGFIWILFSRQRQGWHDKIARTCVVYVWEARPDDLFLRRGLRRLQAANERRYGAPPETLD